MTEHRTVALQSDGDRIHRWLNRVVADAIATAAEGVERVREWCDETEQLAKEHLREPHVWLLPEWRPCCHRAKERLDAIEEVRALLPAVPEAGSTAGEVSGVGTRVTRRDEREY